MHPARGLRWALRNIWIWLGIIAVATLVPRHDEGVAFSYCLVCGDHGTADALANVLLFVPFGLALGWRVPSRWAFLLPLLVSAAVECLQIGIPGRYPGIGDVLMNSAGGVVGMLLARTTFVWWSPAERVRQTWFWSAFVFVLITLTATSWLAGPAPTHAAYFGQRTPELRNLPVYDGEVQHTSLGDETFGVGPLGDQASLRIRSYILTGQPIRAAMVTGTEPPMFAPVFGVVDGAQRQVFLAGIDRTDLVFRYRSRASRVRLDGFEWRAPDLLDTVGPGQQLALLIQHGRDGVLFEANGSVQHLFAPNISSGWRFLLGTPSQAALAWWGDHLWISVLFGAVAFWARKRAEWYVAVFAGAALMLVLPYASWLPPTPAASHVAAGLGMLAGALLGVKLRPRAAAEFN